MDAGKKEKGKFSPIVRAIASVERHTTAEVRVHVSKSWIERDAYAHARRIFHRFGMDKTKERNGVLIYVNLRRHQFAIVGDEGIHSKVGQAYWSELAKALHEDLQSTNPENAIGLAVRTVGATLQRYFPAQAGRENPNELSNEVSTD